MLVSCDEPTGSRGKDLTLQMCLHIHERLCEISSATLGNRQRILLVPQSQLGGMNAAN